MFDIEQDGDFPDYIDTIPVISQAMEFELDIVITFLSKGWGFASTKQFAEAVINDTLDEKRLRIYNGMIGNVIEKHRHLPWSRR